MNLFILAAGIITLLITMLDALWTTLWAAGHAGPLSRFVIMAPRRIATGFTRHGIVLSVIGPLTLVCTIGIWMVLVWFGWSLVFLADIDAFIRVSGEPVGSVWDVVYYAGFAVFSLGVGDVNVTTPAWQMATVLAVVNGLFVVTLTVTYVLSVVSHTVDERTFATEVLSIGKTPAELAVALWGSKDRQHVVSLLGHLSRVVSTLGEQHFAYPVLHAYRSPERFRAPEIAVAVLDEALTIAEHGLREDLRPDPLLVKRLRSSIGVYLDSLEGTWVRKKRQVPPAPSLEPVRLAGLPAIGDEDFDRRLESIAEHRGRLRALLEGTTWSWDAVYDDPDPDLGTR